MFSLAMARIDIVRVTVFERVIRLNVTSHLEAHSVAMWASIYLFIKSIFLLDGGVLPFALLLN